MQNKSQRAFSLFALMFPVGVAWLGLVATNEVYQQTKHVIYHMLRVAHTRYHAEGEWEEVNNVVGAYHTLVPHYEKI